MKGGELKVKSKGKEGRRVIGKKEKKFWRKVKG